MSAGENGHNKDFAIVAIGASAGGLAALKTFFSNVDREPGAAYVVVVHLAPDRESFLPELLQPHAPFPVQPVTQTVALEPNRVYVIPPGSYLSAVDSHLRLAEPAEKRYQHGPIDHFFRTLAATHDGEAMAIVLTGTGSDGALGIKAIKEKGGVTIVQDPEEAEYDGMPRSAIATGAVDLILPIAQIPSQLQKLARFRPQPLPPSDDMDADARKALQGIFAQVKARTRRDFSRHKTSTILRRIERRMQLRQVATLDAYLQVLRESPDEASALANEFLINVTSFFRDPEVFAALEVHVIPELFAGRTASDSIRAWSVGCATGEEAYSLAMLLTEAGHRESTPPRIQVFASDLHESSLASARDGLYGGHIETDLSPQRLARFFVKETQGYRIRSEIRDEIVFAQHDLLGDPPFSRMDLIVCRNLLIYLKRDAQRDAIELFHYALNPGGFLVLGNAESLDEPELFHVEHGPRGIYRKRNVPSRGHRLPAFGAGDGAHLTERLERPAAAQPGSYGALHQKMVERYALPSVLVGPGGKTVHVSQRAGRYLQVPGGELTTDILNLVRPELAVELHAALETAMDKRIQVKSPPVVLTIDGEPRQVVMHLGPAAGDSDEDGYVLIVFDESDPPPSLPAEVVDGARAEEFRVELSLAKQRLHSMAEEYASAREEMRSSNEELQSANEELRSTMEELETSKEELQSINEELVTLNQENRHKVEELSLMSSDLQNLIVATDIPTLFVDRGLRILRFTPRLSDVFNVRSTDRGRPLSDLTHRLKAIDLIALAQRVLADLTTIEQEVEDTDGQWYLLRMRPYLMAEDRIGGVVLTCVDITAQKRALVEIQKARDHAERVIDTIAEPLLILTSDLKVQSANRSFYEHFRVAPRDTVGRLVYDLGNRQWHIPALLTLLEEVLPQNTAVDDFEVTHTFEGLGERTVLVNARPLNISDLVLVGFRDVTDLKRVEQSLREADRRKDEFLATLAHELRNPLAAITSALSVLRKQSPKAPSRPQEILEKQTAHLVRLVDDLLDLSRITRGKIELRRQLTSLNEVVRDVVAAAPIPSTACEINVEVPRETLYALVDPHRIAQVVSNLITNACRYSKDDPRVSVTLSRTDKEAVIAVRDNGVGIPPELLSFVFDMFVQLETSMPNRDWSLGIGLTLVRSLVELHGGRVEAASQGPGTGSEFRVYLPLDLRTESQTASSTPTETEDEPNGRVLRALVVDDNHDAADMMAELLQSDGHTVRVAYDGGDALETFGTTEIDLARVDLAMPGIDGYEVARRVRQDPRLDGVCLVAVTGFGQREARERSKAAGFGYHLVKPITASALQDIIAGCGKNRLH